MLLNFFITFIAFFVKIILSISYIATNVFFILLIPIFGLYIGSKHIKDYLNKDEKGIINSFENLYNLNFKNKFYSILFTIIANSIIILQFGLLTGIYSYKLFFWFLFLFLLSIVIEALLHSIAGLGTREKDIKISLLLNLYHFERDYIKNFELLNLITFVCKIFIIILNLLVFWYFPIGSKKAIVIIALLHFLFSRLFDTLFLIYANFELITSEDYDDDFRNYTLINNFTSTIFQSVYYIFTIIILKDQISFLYYSLNLNALINFDILIYILMFVMPFILFIFNAIVPFFIGINKHKIKRVELIRQQIDFYKKIIEISRISDDNTRNTNINIITNTVETEVEKICSKNDLLKTIILVQSELDTDKYDLVFLVLKDNIDEFKKWLITFKYVEELKSIGEFTKTTNIANETQYLEECLKNVEHDLEEANNTSNSIMGFFIPIVLGISGFIISIFKEKLLSFI